MQQRLSVCSWLTGSCWGQIQGALFLGQGEPAPLSGSPCWTGRWEGELPSGPPTGTCGVRGSSSLRLQLVTGLCPPCPLGLQGGSPAAWI